VNYPFKIKTAVLHRYYLSVDLMTFRVSGPLFYFNVEVIRQTKTKNKKTLRTTAVK